MCSSGVTHETTYPKAVIANVLYLNELKDGLKGRIGWLSFRPRHGKDSSMSQRHNSEREREHVVSETYDTI
jgi:hypothetical protein